MTATVDAKTLAAAAAWANRAVPTKTPVPVLTAVPVEVTEDRLIIGGFDYEVSATARVPADGDLPRTLVNGALLAQVTARLSGDISITLDEGRLSLSPVGRPKGRVRLAVVPGDDYPRTPQIPTPCGTAPELAAALPRVTVAASTGAGATNVGELDCVKMVSDSQRLHLYATDRYRMHHAVTPWDGDPIDVSVHAKRLTELVANIGGMPRLGFSDSLLSVSDGARTATILRPEKGVPPALPGFFDKTWDWGTLTAPRGALLDAVRDTALTAEKNAPVVMAISTDGVVLSSSADGRSDADWPVDGEFDTDPVTVQFNPGYLVDALAAIPEPWVRIFPGSTSSKPVLIDGVVEPGADADRTTEIIIMPVRIATVT